MYHAHSDCHQMSMHRQHLVLHPKLFCLLAGRLAANRGPIAVDQHPVLATQGLIIATAAATLHMYQPINFGWRPSYLANFPLWMPIYDRQPLSIIIGLHHAYLGYELIDQ